RKVELLEMAHRADSNDFWAALQLAREYAASDAVQVQQKERTLLDKIHAEDPTFLPGTIALAQWYSDRGFDQKALRMIESLAPSKSSDALKIPRYLSNLAYLQSITGERKKADALYRDLEGIAATNTSYAWIRTTDLIAENKI